jgi:hypothetical protein
MTRTPLRRPGSSRNALLGIVRVACGRADGLRQFTGTAQAFLASLAPLIAFPLVGGALVLLQGGRGWGWATELMATLCALLAPPVLSFELARLWGREADWLCYATAWNWCQWAIPVIATILLVLVFPLLASGMSPSIAAAGVVAALGCYALWLHWFVARHALRLSVLRAALLVLAVNLGTLLLVVGPSLLTTGVPPLARSGA